MHTCLPGTGVGAMDDQEVKGILGYRLSPTLAGIRISCLKKPGTREVEEDEEKEAEENNRKGKSFTLPHTSS